LKLLYLLLQLSLLGRPIAPETEPLEYVCPMDPEVRSSAPGTCSRCGMKLTVVVADLIEYGLNLRLHPQNVFVNRPVELILSVIDPKTSEPVRRFEIVHEKPFHLFILSEDLNYFAHVHPEQYPDYSFHFETLFGKSGMYRVVCDFFPKGGTPQLLARTVFVTESRGVPALPDIAKLNPDLSEKHGSNVDVDLVAEPSQPIAGMKTRLLFRLSPAEGIEPYLGAWGHMLIASDDLVDVMHHHPSVANGGEIQFSVIFPRARIYRIWVQFQRHGVVNTVVFNLPALSLSSRK
jgi:heavy metal-binding protein